MFIIFIPPTAVDGGYSTWLPWSDCSVSCGGPGQSFRVRNCDNPKPQYNGQPCQGNNMELKTCDNGPCSGGNDFHFKG